MKKIVALMNSRSEAEDVVQELVNNGFDREKISMIGSETGPEGIRRGGFQVALSADDNVSDKAVDIMHRQGAIGIEQTEELQEISAVFPQREPQVYESPRPAQSQEQEQPGLVAGQRPQGFGAAMDPELLAQREAQGAAAGEPGGYGSDQQSKSASEQGLSPQSTEYPPSEQPSLAPSMPRLQQPAQGPALQGEGVACEGVIPVALEETEIERLSTEVSEEGEIVYHSQHRVDAELEEMSQERQAVEAGWSTLDDEEYHRHFDTTYHTGERFESYRSAYHYAESRSKAPWLEGKDWPEVEEDIHQDWERTHPEPWANVKEAIHYGWDRFHRRQH